MPIRIYDISKKLGLENKDVLAKAKELGITAAKVPSSALDRITAEYLEEKLTGGRPVAATAQYQEKEAPTLSPKPSVVITATGAEIYQLVERILNGEVQLRIDISDDEHNEPLHVILAREASQQPTEPKPKPELQYRAEVDERTKRLLRTAYHASTLNSSEEWVNLAEFGNAVKKLDPRFQPQDFGERSLGSLLRRVTELFELRNDEFNPIVYYLRMKDSPVAEKSARQPVRQTSPDKSAPTVSPSESKSFLPQFMLTPYEKAEPLVSLSGPQVTSSHLAPLARGKIHNLKLGFGFIMPDDGSENAFFHATDVEGCTIFDLKSGDAVEYEPGTNERGPCARKVRRIV